jgi:chromosome segregation ATPase
MKDWEEKNSAQAREILTLQQRLAFIERLQPPHSTPTEVPQVNLLLEEKAKLETIVSELQRKKNDEEVLLRDARSEVRSLIKKAEILSLENTNFMKVVEEKNKKLEELHVQILELKKENSRLSAVEAKATTDSETEKSKDFGEVQTNIIACADERANNAEIYLLDAYKKLAIFKAASIELQHKCEAISSSMFDIGQQKVALENQIGALKADVAAHQNEIKALTAEKAEMSSSIDVMEEELESANEIAKCRLAELERIKKEKAVSLIPARCSNCLGARGSGRGVVWEAVIMRVVWIKEA